MFQPVRGEDRLKTPLFPALAGQVDFTKSLMRQRVRALSDHQGCSLINDADTKTSADAKTSCNCRMLERRTLLMFPESGTHAVIRGNRNFSSGSSNPLEQRRSFPFRPAWPPFNHTNRIEPRRPGQANTL